MKKTKTFIVLAIVCVMSMGSILTVYAGTPTPGTCTTAGCDGYRTLVKTNQSIGRCSVAGCPYTAYFYRCPLWPGPGDGIIPGFYHQTAEVWCDNGHKN